MMLQLVSDWNNVNELLHEAPQVCIVFGSESMYTTVYVDMLYVLLATGGRGNLILSINLKNTGYNE